MSNMFLASRAALPAPPPGRGRVQLSLESYDGRRRIPLDGSTGWKALTGATGLEMPPVDVITASLPGVHGSTLQDVRVAERPVFLPIVASAADTRVVTHQAMMRQIMELVDPLNGEFRIVAATPASERELRVIYTGGLEGDYGMDRFGMWWQRFGLTATACDPFARDRQDRELKFQAAAALDPPFLGVVGGTDAPFPPVIRRSAVIGEGMEIRVASEAPVYPVLELTGPMDSFAGTLSPIVVSEDGSTSFHDAPSWSVDISAGIPAGKTLRLVTDPRARSIRLDGVLAAGMVARGSSLRPFYPGLNVLNVSAPGSTEETLVRLSWREAHRSLW